MRRSPALAAAIIAGLMMIPLPAQAKFVVRVVIDGPGLVEPVELPNTEIRVGCTFSKHCRRLLHPPDGALGPRYMVTQWLEGHHARGLMMDRIVHDLYPWAPGGPWVFTASGQTWHDWSRIRQVPGGWTPADRSLMSALRANGLPAEPPAERVAAAAPGAEATQGVEPGTLGALVGVGVLVAGGTFLRTRSRHGSPRA